MYTPYKPIFNEIEVVANKFRAVLETFSETQVNVAPAADSWTAAQVAMHLTRSTGSLAKALQAPGTKATRKADEKVKELEAMFLNFDTKMSAPEFTRPAIKDYEKCEVLMQLKAAYSQALEAGHQANLTELFTIPGLGELTKFELLMFILVHTKRHLNQLEKIAAVVMHKPS